MELWERDFRSLEDFGSLAPGIPAGLTTPGPPEDYDDLSAAK